jgi:hypothetical protein
VLVPVAGACHQGEGPAGQRKRRCCVSGLHLDLLAG